MFLLPSPLGSLLLPKEVCRRESSVLALETDTTAMIVDVLGGGALIGVSGTI